MSAWLTELGRPSHQVMRFQVMAPDERRGHDDLRGGLLVDDARADRLGDRRAGEGADEVERRRHEQRVLAGGGPGSRPRSRSRSRCRGSR